MFIAVITLYNHWIVKCIAVIIAIIGIIILLLQILQCFIIGSCVFGLGCILNIIIVTCCCISGCSCD